MRKKSYYVLVFMLLFVFVNTVMAMEKVIITGYDVRFRSNPTTSSNILDSFYPGVELTLIDRYGGSGNGCDSSWLKVLYNGTYGYVCGSYAEIKEVEEDNSSKVEEVIPSDELEYRKYLLKEGFPESYLDSLVALHKKYPNWKFKVFKADISFNEMLGYEYKSNGRSLIEDYGRYYDGYKSTDSWSYNYFTDTFSNRFEGGGDYWFAANKETIGYYMDPRNFLNEEQIFMFETLSYNKVYHTKEGIERMLQNTFMTGYADKDNQKTFVDAFTDAAVKYNISPYVLISRVIQEVGAQGSTIVSGTVYGYENYYNFYNINAAGNSKEETINKGLAYAKEQGWDSPYKAIVGGGYFLSDKYISQGQDTLYLQKWDLFGPMYGAHQYMQNIQAPSTESRKTYRGYKNVSLLNSDFTFSIPVFTSMPSKTSLPNKGNPNNYLSSLAINGSYLFESATNETVFNLNLDSNTSSIAVDASKISNRATISGVGSVALNGEKQTISVKVTAENGAVREYKINITRKIGLVLDISEILRVLEIKNDGTYIYGIMVGTDIQEIIKKITTKEPQATVTYFDEDGKEKTSGIVSSFDKINIKTPREEKNYTFIIYGDVNGDGKISSADYIIIKNDIMDVKKLSDVERIAGDANKDGKVNSADYITIKNDIMDVKKIEQ